jgi:hypothetical protein
MRQKTNYLKMNDMEPTIEIKSGNLCCKMGRQANGFVNVFTNFAPLSRVIIVLELEEALSIEYISNVANYGDGTGGLSVKLKEGKTEKDFEEDLRYCLGKEALLGD